MPTHNGFHVKHDPQPELEAYAACVRSGPHGLLSTGDLARIDDHIADACAGVPELAGATSIVDVGSGGGLPGIPLALALPDCTVHLVESLGWKAAFLRETLTTLGCEDRVTVHCHRAEDAVEAVGRESIEVGVARAVAAPVIIAEYLSPFVAVGGRIAAWSTRTVAAEPFPVAAEASLGLGPLRVVDAPSALRADGVLLVWDKVASCDPRFPRRTGVARKRPLDR